ncbi:MAG: hypothetical protein HYU36_10615 [Planctomycetes bacterium]|nr:hypothetical protein [Planctomycetota bacterium]
MKKMRFRYAYQRDKRNKLVAYIRERRKIIPNYKWLFERSFTIGTGEVEDAVKSLLHSRLRGPGMRWSTEGADLVMSARCTILNGTWEHDLLQPACRAVRGAGRANWAA